MKSPRSASNMIVILAVVAAVAALDEDHFRYSPLGSVAAQPLYSGAYAQPLFPQVYQKPLVARVGQPLYANNAFSKYIHEPTYVQHIPAFGNGLPKYQQYQPAPAYSNLALKAQYHHAPLLAHPVIAQPALSAYSTIAKPAAYQYAEKLHHSALPSAYAAAYSGPAFRILEQERESDPIGNYRFSFATENGIQASEQSIVKGEGPEGPVSAKQGSYSYTGPDGVVYTVNWEADENGYRASGAHLPQIPEEIKRSLEFNAEHPTIEGSRK